MNNLLKKKTKRGSGINSKLDSLSYSGQTKDSSKDSDSIPPPSHTTSHPTLDGDYSKVIKPSNQISVAEYWKYMDQYFRLLMDEDLKRLETPGDDFTPYIIPTSILNPIPLLESTSPSNSDSLTTISSQFRSLRKKPQLLNYHDVWEYEDKSLVNISNSMTHYPPTYSDSKEYYEEGGSGDTIWPGDLSYKPFIERLLSCLIIEKNVNRERLDGILWGDESWDIREREREEEMEQIRDSGRAGNGPTVGSIEEDEFLGLSKRRNLQDMEILEERLKKELIYIGLFNEEEVSFQFPCFFSSHSCHSYPLTF